MRDSASPNEECSLFLFLNSMGLDEWPSAKVRTKVLEAIRSTIAVERERGRIRRAASKAAAALLLMLPMVGVAVIGSSLAACASPQTLADIDQELVSLDVQIEVLEAKEATGTLSEYDRIDLVELRHEQWKLRDARRIVNPATGPAVAADWFTRVMRGDPRSIGEAGAGAASLWALYRLKKRKREQRAAVADSAGGELAGSPGNTAAPASTETKTEGEQA